MKRLGTVLILISLMHVGAFNSVGQQKPPGPDKPNGQTDTFKLIAAKFALGKTIKGAPFSATAITETIQTLSDGNQIIHKSESAIYRDSEGRTRNEGTIDRIGKWAISGDAEQVVFINDPVTGFAYSLTPRSRTAYKYRITMQTISDMIDVGGPKPNMTKPTSGKTVDKPWARNPSQTQPPEGVAKLKLEADTASGSTVANPRRKTESLGKQLIEGVEAEGTRITLTIAAGEIGNTLPIQILDENWYSPELQMMIATKHIDPRSGETTYWLTNLNRREPNRALFEVPADYTVRENSILPKPKPIKEEQ